LKGADVVKTIKEAAAGVHRKIRTKKKPTMRLPVRSLSNVKYDPKKGYFQLRGASKVRTLTVGTVKTFAQTLKMMALSKELIETDDIASKREAYYISKNWGDAAFKEQPESDAVMDDVEAMFGPRSRHGQAASDRLHEVRLGRLFHPHQRRGPGLPDEREVHSRH